MLFRARERRGLWLRALQVIYRGWVALLLSLYDPGGFLACKRGGLCPFRASCVQRRILMNRK
jgi:hypothetical protein